MKLSEAIRLGAMLRPQGYGEFFSPGKNTVSCALGAACEAVAGVVRNMRKVQDLLRTYWPWLDGGDLATGTSCPAVGCLSRMADYGDVVVHLNDCHEWPRERVAQWVQTVEPSDVPQGVVCAAAV